MKHFITQLIAILMTGSLVLAQNPAQAPPKASLPPEISFLPNYSSSFANGANLALERRLTASDLDSLATRIAVQADVWKVDGSAEKIDAYVHYHPEIASELSVKAKAALYSGMRLKGWRGTEDDFTKLIDQTQANRNAAYRALATKGVHAVFYEAATQLHSLAKSAQVNDARLITVQDQCSEFGAVFDTVLLTGAMFAAGTVFGCLPCAGIAAMIGLFAATLRFEMYEYSC